jgi:hypothetical protein
MPILLIDPESFFLQQKPALLPESGMIPPPNNKPFASFCIPVFLNIRMTLLSLTCPLVVTKTAFERLVSRTEKLAQVISQERYSPVQHKAAWHNWLHSL